MPDWTDAFPLSALQLGHAKVLKRGRDQVAVFRVDGDQLYAVDNRCPHEGYPLAQGALADCTLTCSWHNFKFDLRDGACLKGDEAVRSYPVRIVEGRVEVDLTPPDPRLAIERLWRSLARALTSGRVGQGVRDSVRLLEAGVSPASLAAFVAADNGVRAEYGATHVLALATDVLRWADRYPRARFAIPLAQVIDLAIRDAQRFPARAAASPADVGDDPAVAGHALQRAVEAENPEAAEAVLLGGLAQGWTRAELEPWFFTLCADHFLSFGHRLIYQVKVFDLLDAAGWEHAAPILRGHLFGIVSATREDTLPAWKSYRSALEELVLPTLFASAGSDPTWAAGEQVTEAVIGGRSAEALDAVAGALRAGASLDAVMTAISRAAAERLLRFDVAIDSDPSVQDTWLSVTHTQTFAHAVRHAVRRHPRPEVLRLVLQAAWFVNHHRVLDQAHTPTIVAAAPDLQATLAAIDERRTDDALAGTAALLSEGRQLDELRDALMDEVVTDRFSVPIVSAHAMKNLVVAFDEWRQTDDPRFVLAAVRLLASPVQERRTHRAALEAVAFVTQGKTPRMLAP